MSDIDKRLDKILQGKVHLESDIESECYANCRAILDAPELKQAIKQLLAEVERRGIKYPIYEYGTQVRGKAGTHEKTWTDKHKATVTGFRYRADGGIDYHVRCWRANTHWWHSENLEQIPDSELCAGCKGLLSQGCKCHRVCPCGCCNG